MRFMIMAMATRESEAAPPPRPEAFAAMQTYNEAAVKAGSLEEAIEWVKRAPSVSPNGEAEVEVRKLMDVEDFGEGFTPNPEIAKVKYR